jgi:hypothetical protein
VAINAAIEYVRKKDVIELVGEDTLRYKSIIINDGVPYLCIFQVWTFN